MGNVLVKEETLTEIADSIREKVGVTDKYKPAEMPEAIRNISPSSNSGPSEEDTIRFYGYEGKLLYSYSLEELKALTELPRLPKVEGMICQGWNWSLENLQSLNREMDVGAIFITDDGSTRIYVSLNEYTLHPMLGFYQRAASCMKVDWGDGSPLESKEVIGEVYWFEHQYEIPGQYVIRLVPEEDADVLVYGSIGGTNLFQKNAEKDRSNTPYSNVITKIEIGKGITYFGEYALMGRNLKYITIPNENIDFRSALYGARNLRFIAMPDTITNIWNNSFNGCTRLEKVCFPNNLQNLYGDAFRDCISLKTVCLPETIKNTGSTWFLGCDSLRSISFPESFKTIPTSVVSGCDRLESIVLGASVKEISSQAFYNCKELSTFTWDAESKLVGRLAFGNCVKLTDFDFMNVEKLYVNSFLGSGVNVVQLGETENEASRTPLTTVEVQSFMDCDNLATLGIGGNVTTIKTQAFANCENLETAVIADSVTEIAEDAFDGCDKLTIYCSENSYAHTYAQTQGIRVSTLVIAPIPNQTYTGFEIKPEISVSASGDTLDKNIDFSVSYANNVNVGNADVNVKGLGDFRMFASKAKFTIVTKNISAVTVAPIADQPYTGTAVTPEITVTDGIKVLREGTDYTVTYANNVNEGTATATITGIGNYSGTATTNFQISKDAEEPGFFAKIFSSISSFFARVISFFASIFM